MLVPAAEVLVTGQLEPPTDTVGVEPKLVPVKVRLPPLMVANGPAGVKLLKTGAGKSKKDIVEVCPPTVTLTGICVPCPAGNVQMI